MKKRFCMLLSFSIPTLVFGQKGTISGTVQFKNGKASEFASVYIAKSTNYTRTDDLGFFKFKKLPYGIYTLNIKYFNRPEEQVTVNLNAKSVNIQYVLSYDEASELDEIVVTGKTKEAKIETKGFAVNAIKMKEIEMQSIEATEVLDRSSGVTITQNGGLGSHTHYNINGLTGNAIRIFINGSPIRSFGPSFSLSSIPTNMIKRIEVYKGVVPVELAGDALGGAINVILKESSDKNSLDVAYSFGSFNTHQASLSANSFNKKNGFTIKGSGFYNYSDNDYSVWGEQVYSTNPVTGDITYGRFKRFHDTYKSGGFKADIGFTKEKWADELLFGVIYSALDRDIQHGATMESVYGNRKADQNTKLVNLSYKDDSFLSKDNLNLELFSSYSHLTRNIKDITPHIYDWDGKPKERLDNKGDFIGYYEYFSGAEAGNPTLQESIEKVHVARATTHYHMAENHGLVANFLYTNFTRDSEDPLRHIDIRNLEDTRFSERNILGLGYDFNTLDDKLKTSVFYKYFSQNIRIVEYLKANEAAPIELNDVNRTVTAKGVGITLAYELFSNILIQVSAENSFRLPVFKELFGNLAQNLEPNYNLEPEKSKNLNLGITLGTFSFGKNEVKIKFNTFVRDTKDKIKINVREDATDPTTEFVNDDNYISKGFDLDVFYSYDRKLDFNGNLSIFNSRFNTEFDENGLRYNWYLDRERNAPFFTANGNLRYSIANLIQEKSQTTFITNLSYVHWFYRDWESLGGTGKDIIPTQLVSDAGIAHTLPNKKTTISFDARNIFNRQVFDNYALQKPGRAFYIKLNYSIF